MLATPAQQGVDQHHRGPEFTDAYTQQLPQRMRQHPRVPDAHPLLPRVGLPGILSLLAFSGTKVQILTLRTHF